MWNESNWLDDRWHRTDKIHIREFVTYQHKDNFWIRMADKQLLDDNIILFVVCLLSNERSRKVSSSRTKRKHEEKKSNKSVAKKHILLSVSGQPESIVESQCVIAIVTQKNIRRFQSNEIPFLFVANLFNAYRKDFRWVFSIMISSDSIIIVIQDVKRRKGCYEEEEAMPLYIDDWERETFSTN